MKGCSLVPIAHTDQAQRTPFRDPSLTLKDDRDWGDGIEVE
jgi:hypothetical protein